MIRWMDCDCTVNKKKVFIPASAIRAIQEAE
jgi:hypothetical protein